MILLYFMSGLGLGLFIGREIECRANRPHLARMKETVDSLLANQSGDTHIALIETLRSRADALSSATYLGHWNAWRHYMGQGGKSDWPREAYKNEIAFDAELMRAAIRELSREDTACDPSFAQRVISERPTKRDHDGRD